MLIHCALLFGGDSFVTQPYLYALIGSGKYIQVYAGFKSYIQWRVSRREGISIRITSADTECVCCTCDKHNPKAYNNMHPSPAPTTANQLGRFCSPKCLVLHQCIWLCRECVYHMFISYFSGMVQVLPFRPSQAWDYLPTQGGNSSQLSLQTLLRLNQTLMLPHTQHHRGVIYVVTGRMYIPRNA